MRRKRIQFVELFYQDNWMKEDNIFGINVFLAIPDRRYVE